MILLMFVVYVSPSSVNIYSIVKYVIMLLCVSWQLTLCVNSDGRKKRRKTVAHKPSKRKCPEGNLVEEQNVDVDVDVDVGDIGPGMWI